MGNQQTKDSLENLLADNTSGDITPARLRDFLESCVPSRGTLTWDATTTEIADAETFVKVSGETELEHDYRFSSSIDGRLQYDGAAAVDAEVLAVLTVNVNTEGSARLCVAVAINGELVEGNGASATVYAGGNSLGTQLVLLANVSLESGDYIELFVANVDGDTDVTTSGRLRVAAFLT